MGTNVKKTKISGTAKAVCVVLSLLFISAAVGLAFNVGRAVFFYDDPLVAVDPEYMEDNSYTKAYMFHQNLIWDVESIAIVAQHESSVSLSRALEKQRKATVDEMVEKYLLEKADIIEAELYYVANNWADSGADYYAEKVYTLPEKQVRHVVEVDPDAPRVVRDVQTILNGTKSGTDYLKYEMLVREDAFDEVTFHAEKSITVDGRQHVFFSDYNDGYIDYTYDEYEIRDELNNAYTAFVEDETDEEMYYDARDNIASFKSVMYYVVNTATGEEFTNLSGSAREQILSSPMHIKLENGECTYKGISDDTMSYWGLADDFDIFTEEYSVYIAIEPTEGDIYYTLKQYDESMQGSNFPVQSALAIVLCITAIVLAVVVLVNCSGTVWIDRLPTDIHLVLTGTLGILAVLGTMGLYWVFDSNETIIYSPLASGLAAVAALVCWAILLEFFCSLVRVCKSDKPFWKNCLVFRIIHWVYIKCKAAVKKLCKTFAYKPRIMKKQFVLAVLLYVAVSGVLNFLFALMLAWEEEFLGFIFFATFIVLSLACAYKLLGYVMALDSVIAAAKERKELPSAGLPSSLQTLADSMQYTNEELRAAVEKAVRDERLRTELITNVSHDLKTPLTSIITYVDLLSGCDIEDEKAKEYIGVLDEKGAKLKRLIDDLLEASKASSGVISLELAPLSLTELAVQAAGESQSDFEAAGLDLILKTADAVTVVADGNKTYRVIENLLSNAKKYSASGSRVYASISKEGGFGVFEIKNISAEPLDISPEELTERFVRGDRSRTKEGNGLGLSITKNLCTAMGGSLELTIDGDLFKACVKLPLE